MKYELRPYQREAVNAAVKFFNEKKDYNAIEVLSTGCHAKGSKILMYDGTFKNVEDISVGDMLMGNNSTPRKVLELHRGIDTMYKISPIQGEPFVVNGGHILHLYKTNSRKTNRLNTYDEISVKEYLEKSNYYKHTHKLHRTLGLYFEHKEIPLPSYLVGLLIGDGSVSHNANITTQRDEVIDYTYNIAHAMGWNVRETRKGNSKAVTLHLAGFGGRKHKKMKNPIRVALEDIGLFGKTAGDKFIPDLYKFNDYDERMQLLGGLLDTDAHYDQQKNEFEYCSKSRRLTEDIQFVCRSVGLYCSNVYNKYVNGDVYYRLFISGDLQLIPTKVCIRKGRERKQKKSVCVTGFSVESVGEGNYYGFTLDGNHLYCDAQFFVHHNSGKSLIIADIADKLDSSVLVFGPSKEIIEQDYAKMKTYTDECSMYSASVGMKEISKITFASIGSVKTHVEDFKHFKYVLVDECHLLNSEEGMYVNFLSMLNCKVLGLTATPYRLTSERYYDVKEKSMRTRNSKLTMLINEDNPFFTKIIYSVETRDMVKSNYLASLRYFDARPKGWNEKRIFKNSTGSDFSESSIKWMMEKTNHARHTTNILQRLLYPNNGIPRRGILAFVMFVQDAEDISNELNAREGRRVAAYVCGTTTKKNREAMLDEFKKGELRILINVGTLTTGFDYPELDTVVLARPTMSLALFYQCVGRAIRPSQGKDGWIVDTVGNSFRFGNVENLKLMTSKDNTLEYFGWVGNEWKQLTGVVLD